MLSDFDIAEKRRGCAMRIQINCRDIESQLHEKDYDRLMTMASEILIDLAMLQELKDA